MSDTSAVESDQAVDDGSEAQQAAQEDAERQAASEPGMDPSGSTSDQVAEGSSPDEPVLGEADSPNDGAPGAMGESGGSSLIEDFAAAFEALMSSGDDEVQAMTPDELNETLGHPADQIAELGGGSSSFAPSLEGGMGDYGLSGQSQPTVANGATPIDWSTGPVIVSPETGEWTSQTYNDANGNTAFTQTTNHETGESTRTWFDKDGNAVEETTTSTYDNEQGGTDTYEETTTANGSTTNVTSTNSAGETTSESTTFMSSDGETGFGEWKSTDEDGNTTTEHAHMNGDKSLTTSTTTNSDGETTNSSVSTHETDENGETTTNTTTTDENGTTTTTTTNNPGPFGDESVPSGQTERHIEELQEQMPDDAGPGNVDPNEYDDGEGDGDPTWDTAPGVDNPPDEGEPTGGMGGTPQDSQGWATTPVEEDDIGGDVGPDDDSMQLPEQQPSLDASQVTGSGDAGAGERPPMTVEGEPNFTPITNEAPSGRQELDDDSFGLGSPVTAVEDTEATEDPQPVEAYLVEVQASVAATPDETPLKTIDADLDETTAGLLADAIDNDSIPLRGESEPDDLDFD